MRTKALVLGALPSPFVGAWVSLENADTWRCKVETFPDLPLGLAATIDVRLSNGGVVTVPVDQTFSGMYARFVLSEKVPGIDSFCAFIEEVTP